MAHVIKLKYGSPASWSYIDLTDANHGNNDYYPGTPAEGADDITESGSWRVAGSSVADLIAKIGEIEQVFYRAGQYALDEIGTYQVWLTVQPSEVAETLGSQVFEGRLELTENVLGVDWANRHTDVVLIWRRTGFWEKYTSIPANNSNVSSGTSIVYNGGDSSGSAPTKMENWLDIAAADVPGDLPAPAVIFMDGISASIDQIHVILNAKTSPTNKWLAEGETGSGDSTDADRSNGKFKDYTTPAGGTTGVNVFYTPTDLDDILSGAWLRYLLSAKFTGTVYARPYIYIGGKIYYGPRSIIIGTGSFGLYDLGMMRMPKGSFGGYSGFTSGFGLFQVGINFIAASAIAISVDYFNYIPTDGYAKATIDNFVNTINVLDSRAQMAFGNDGGAETGKISCIGTLYGGIYLEPNLAQRLHFKFNLAGADVLTNYATFTVSAYLRKRTL